MKYIFSAVLLSGFAISMIISIKRYVNRSQEVNQKWIWVANLLMLGGFVGLLIST